MQSSDLAGSAVYAKAPMLRRRPAARYFASGVALGLAAPLGFLALARMLGGTRAGPRWLSRSASSGRLAIMYMGVCTPIVFGLFGRILGQREEALHASSQQIERLREEFAAIVAHDLRNPISAILLQLEVLERGAVDGEVTVPISTLQKLRRGGERLAQMVKDLLDATRIEAARLSLQPESISLPDAARNLVDRIRLTLGSHPVEVAVEGQPPRVSADPARLDQILTNLVENAAKYSKEGTPILIRVRPERAGARISVEDRGMGIANDELPKLFDRFYQAKRARQKKSGLGLGLYITKGLVDAHGGQIRVESVPDQGSIFDVWLPAQP